MSNVVYGNKADDLSNLKEGDIFVDENGKKYRARKTILPQSAATGPVGEGDPDDKTLRKIEADVLIPNRINREIEQNACRDTYLQLVNCLRKEGDIKGIKLCQPVLDVYNRCKEERFHDPQFRQMITDRYLEERAAFRRTGKSSSKRRLEEYREWKEANSNLSNAQNS